MGPGGVPGLPSRLDHVREDVSRLRRAQVIRDLCVIACADGHVTEEELAVIRDITAKIEVELDEVSCVLDLTAMKCAPQRRL